MAIKSPKSGISGDDRSGQRDASREAAVAERLDNLLSERASGSSKASVVVLCGDEAPWVAATFTRSAAGRPCARIDFGQILLSNPYELVAFRFLGMLGEILNTYVKAAIFVGSLLSQRHPHVDALLYIHSACSNFNKAVEELASEGRRPVVVVQNVDYLVNLVEASAFPETKGLASLLCCSVSQQSLQLADDGLADVVWIIPSHDVLKGPAFQKIRTQAHVVEVRHSWGGIALSPRRVT